MSTYRNNVAMTVSGTPGTGTITLNAAVTGAQSFASAYAGNATVDLFITDGNAWEVARDCTYTNSGTTVTRGTLEASSTGSALSLTSAAVVRVAASASTVQQLALDSIAGPDAATTMAIGKRYLIDLSAFTADRTYTLPATCAVGDRIQVIVTVGSASYEVLFTAASGDTLNGVSGGTEWSRLFIENETLTFVCTVANSAWRVEIDGRIPCYARIEAASSEALTASTFVKVTLGTTARDNANLATGSSTLTIRRTGHYSIMAGGTLTVVDATATIIHSVYLGSSEFRRVFRGGADSGGAGGGGNSLPSALSADDALTLRSYGYKVGGGNVTMEYTANVSVAFLSVLEALRT
jgi:hypothetical protein